MKVVTGGSPLQSKGSPQFDDAFNGCYRQNDTRSYSICGENPRLVIKDYCGNSNNFSKEISRSRSLLREADCHIDLLNSARIDAQETLPTKNAEALATPDSYEDCYSSGSPQSNCPTRLLCPISFQPFIAFQGLYATTSCEIDNSMTVEASQRSPTGLIAPPYIPANTGNTETEMVAAFTEKGPDCNKIVDSEDSKSINSQSPKMDDNNDDRSQNPPLSEVNSSSFNGNKPQGVTPGCNHTVNSTVAGIETLSDQDCLMALGSDISDHRAASPLISINVRDDFDTKCLSFARRDTSRADHTSNLLMPSGKGIPLDLLANSLHTLAQHSRSSETDHPLSMTSHGLHPSPKQISLTLPFKEVLCYGNKIYETPDCGTTVDFGDDESSNIGMSPTKAERIHGHHDNMQSFHSSEMGLRSTLTTDAEISPMSPPSYLSYSDLYCQQNIQPDVGVTTLPTIFEGPHKVDLPDRNLVTPCPLSELEHPSPGEDCSTLESLGSPKRGRSVLDTDNNISMNESTVYSKGAIIKGDSQLGKELQYKPNIQAAILGNTSHVIHMKKEITFPRKLGKKGTHRFKNKKAKLKYPSQILSNLLIAGVGVLLSQVSMNNTLLQITPWVNLALSVTMRSASVVVILAAILVLDQRKE